MDKEVVHINNGILLNYKEECIWVSSNEVDEHRVYYIEWNKSETEKQTSYSNAYIWNLERWYQWCYMQNSQGDTEIKNRLLNSVGGEGGMIWDTSTETYTLPYVK